MKTTVRIFFGLIFYGLLYLITVKREEKILFDTNEKREAIPQSRFRQYPSNPHAPEVMFFWPLIKLDMAFFRNRWESNDAHHANWGETKTIFQEKLRNGDPEASARLEKFFKKNVQDF